MSATQSGRGMARDAAAAAGAALAWWTGTLATMLPARLRRRGEGTLTVSPTPDGLSITRDTPDGAEVVAGPVQRACTAVLRLPSDLVLARTITLAQAAEENLHEVIGFQLDRYTPFERDEVYLGCQVVGRDPDTEAVTVAIAVARRTDVTALIDTASRQGITCTRVAAAAEAFELAVKPGDIMLDWGTQQEAAAPNRWLRWLWAVACVLLVADLALPLVRGHTRLAALQGELAAVRREAQDVAALRDTVDQAIELAALPVQRWQRTPLSALLAELTRLVPDTGWVTQIEIDPGTVQLTGYAASANALIPVLEQSPLFANAAFRSPVTQDAVHGVEQFHLSAELRRRNE